MKKVSIIVPIFNTADYLDRCINSIRNQSYSNIEVILVNDGSTDNSKELCEKQCKQDSRIKLINKSNTGQSDSRYIGFINSVGDYIYCVDSDDTLEQDAIEILVNGLENTNSDMFLARFNLIDQGNNIIGNSKKYNVTFLNTKDCIISDALSAQNIKASLCIKICKRYLWEQCYTTHVRNTHFNEDYFLTILFSIRSSSVGFSNKIVYNALRREGSTCRALRKDLILAHDVYFSEIINTLKSLSLNDTFQKNIYLGYAKNMYLSLYLLASKANRYQVYKGMYDLLGDNCIFNSSNFISTIRRKSMSYRLLDMLIRKPFLFYIISKIISLKHKF